MSGRRVVAVVGGGASGVLASVALLRRTDADVVLIEPDELGGGVAYGASARPWHLLNSRAGAMSAYPDDPGHFVRWAGVEPCDFMPRRAYGRYLREVLDWAAVAHPGRFRWVRARVSDVRTDPAVILDDGREIRADDIVLALGNPQGGRPEQDPWRPGVLEGLPHDERPILLVGTGLTAVDVALTLHAGDERRLAGGERRLAGDERRHAGEGRRADTRVETVSADDAGPGAFWDGPAWSGPDSEQARGLGASLTGRTVIAYSRRGLLPLGHVERPAELVFPDLAGTRSLREVVRAVRAATSDAADWRAVVDGLRPQTDAVWARLGDREREAFLRHLSRLWECHRHRMAPPVAARIDLLRRTGRLVVRKGPPPPELSVGGIVNCAGPGRLPGAATGLTATLLRKGLARVGPYGLGLDVDHSGRIQRNVWVLGPLRRGVRWETTAVPEIRAQASELAEEIAEADLRTNIPIR